MSYNIWNGAVDRLESIVSIVNTENPDILVVNEANGFEEDNNKILNQFAIETGFPFYHMELCGDGDSYHAAVFSKYPLKKIDTVHPLTRAGILAVIDTEFGELAVFGTHLSPESEEWRLKEAALIIKSLQQYPNRIVVGDLNSLSPQDNYPESLIEHFHPGQIRKFTVDGKVRFDVIKTFLNSGLNDPAVLSGRQADITAPTALNRHSEHSNMRLDYILLSDSLVKNDVIYRVIKNELTEHASDHFPVIVEIS